MTDTVVQNKQQGTFLGHPKGLFVLFFTEMWERFSYYGMRALLVLYLVNIFKMTQEDASRIYKWYTALVYLTPLLGGYLADRYLGNKWAIVIGSILMAIGQFVLASGQSGIFMVGLGFLIIGNGFFKPNMSVQVGRLYPQNDPRRDGAYTIFYMGINLGAFLAPLICGSLRNTPGLGFTWGFGAAGVGMLLGLIIYLVGLRWIHELPDGVQYKDPSGGHGTQKNQGAAPARHAMTESEAGTAPSAIPRISGHAPGLLAFIGVAFLAAVFGIYAVKLLNGDDALAFGLGLGAACFAGAWITSQIQSALRDRVLAIFALAVFVVFFWTGFEQAGSSMNVWADQFTNRFLTGTPPDATPYPAVFTAAAERGFGTLVKDTLTGLVEINPVQTESFQSVNAAAIVILAPVFAWLWVFLSRRNIRPSIAAKMATGVFLVGTAFALMTWSVKYESGPSESRIAKLPPTIVPEGDRVFFYDAPSLGQDAAFERFQAETRDEKSDRMIAHGGRMRFEAGQGVMHINGVLDENHRDRMLRGTAPKEFVRFAWELARRSNDELAKKRASGAEDAKIEAKLSPVPPGFDAKYLVGFNPKEISFDANSGTFVVRRELADQDYKQLLVAGADPVFRGALNDLWKQSTKYRVGSSWLLWFYVLCTLGELCLSPVGLSMVSKLAPRRFATMLMGMWLLTSFFGNFTAGLLAQNWERLDPNRFFTYVTIAMVAAAFVCYLVAKKITQMMHGVD